jgi:glyoxylase-like metal-dependent hydrolase (beta-lactamase superfamily II)
MLERDVAEGIHRVEDAYTNWYLVEGEGGVTVVDAGVRTSWRSLGPALREIGRCEDDLRGVLLTHAHFDHIGFAERARRELGLTAYVHENDAPLARHPRQYSHERPRLPYFATQLRALPIVASLVRSRAFWPTPLSEVSRFADTAPALPGLPRLVPTPGHTLGHVSFHFPERDAVLAGDALVTLDPYTARRGPCLVAGAATADFKRNFASLDALAQTGARIVLSGHGPAWTGGAEAAVERARLAGAA